MTQDRPLRWSPHPRATTWQLGVLLSLACAFNLACDDDPPNPRASYELSFEDPADGASLGCADDQNRSTSGVIERDVPSLIMAGDCDAVVTYDQLTAAHTGSANTGLLTVEGGGHHAFSDICTVDLHRSLMMVSQ